MLVGWAGYLKRKMAMKNKFKLGLFFLFFSLLSLSAQALTADVSISNTVAKAMRAAATTNILPMALTWLGAFMSIQFVITNFGLLKSGADIETVIGKLIGSMVWFVFCVYVVNNAPDLIDTIGTNALTKFSPGLTSGSIIAATVGLCTVVIGGIAALGTSILGVGNTSLAMVLVYVLFAVFAAGMFVAIKIFMLSLELGLVVMLSPLSFSFLGFNAFKDQGISPFKSLISLLYRIILVGIICSAFGQVINDANTAFAAIDWTSLSDYGTAFHTIITSLVSFPVLVYLLYKSDSLAASLASGSTSMGTGDIAGAVAAGVAGGMAVAAASQVAAAGTASMGDFMKNMMGGGGISNAGGTGSGNPSSQPIPDASALSSLSSSGTQPSMSLDDVRAAEQVGAGGGSPAGVDAGVDAGGGSSGGAATALFSKADGAAAASAVPATASQNTRNAAAVGAAMRASGAPESMAALAENIVADGGGAQGVANACGTTPAQNAAVDNALAGAAEIGGGSSAPASSSGAGDPGWLDSGSAVSPGGSGANAGIGNGGAETAQKPTMSDHLSNLGKRMGEAGKHLENTSAATHVSISTHSQD
jgi:type IV secretion system protein TrbL